MLSLARLLCSLVLSAAMLWPRDAAAEVLVVGKSAETLQATLDAASAGDVVEVPEGTWPGGITIDKRITLRGRGGVIDGGGKGTVVRVTAPGAVVEGLKIVASGDDLGAPDACVYVSKEAVGARLAKNELRGCAFGIWIHETEKAEIVGNRVIGTLLGHRSNRGNGIHLFNASNLVLRDNVISGGRDGIYVSAVEDSLIENNHFEATRYGVHYMFSYSNILRNNTGVKNFSGFALMGSRYIKVLGNVATGNEEYGLLLRDIEDCEIRDNRLENNGLGLLVYSSIDNQIVDNVLVANEVGAKNGEQTVQGTTGVITRAGIKTATVWATARTVWIASRPTCFTATSPRRCSSTVLRSRCCRTSSSRCRCFGCRRSSTEVRSCGGGLVEAARPARSVGSLR